MNHKLEDFCLAICDFIYIQNYKRCVYVCYRRVLSSPLWKNWATSLKSRQLIFAAVKNVKTERSSFNGIKQDLRSSSHNGSQGSQSSLMCRSVLVSKNIHINICTIYIQKCASKLHSISPTFNIMLWDSCVHFVFRVSIA